MRPVDDLEPWLRRQQREAARHAAAEEFAQFLETLVRSRLTEPEERFLAGWRGSHRP